MDGITADLLPYIAEISELAAAAPQSFDRDEAAANHYQVFVHDVFPYESIFRDPSGLLGGSFTDHVKVTYESAGILFGGDTDHIGHELAFLAALCKAEASALETEAQEAAAQYKRLQGDFLREHLLTWLPALVTALSTIDDPFYEAVGQLTHNIVYDHLLAVGKLEPAQTAAIGDLLDVPDILKNEQTNLKQIAGFLVTPPYSGLYLSRGTVSSLARRRQIPRGFGSRQQMLSNLLHTAAQYDLIPDLLQDLAAHAGHWTQQYQKQIALFPEMSLWIQPWLQRAGQTAGTLSAMRTLSIAAL